MGHDTPFDRLVKCVDNWCQITGEANVFGQIGKVSANSYRPSSFRWVEFLSPDKFKEVFDTASLVVSHAGTGTMITALLQSKPIIVMPRRSNLSETRNDHQIATVNRFRDRPQIIVASDASELEKALDSFSMGAHPAESSCVSPYANNDLTLAVRNFILDGR